MHSLRISVEKLQNSMEKARDEQAKRQRNRLATAEAMKRDDPQGTLRLLNYGVDMVRRQALKDSKTIPLEPHDGDWDRLSAELDSFVRCPAYVCLLPDELRKMITTQANRLALRHIGIELEQVGGMSDEGCKRLLREFVVDKRWARLLTPSQRVTCVETELSKPKYKAKSGDRLSCIDELRALIVSAGLDEEF